MAFTAIYSAETTSFSTAGRIYRATGGGAIFSADLRGETAFDLFDNAAVVNDAIYFTRGAYQQSIAGLKFNVGTAISASSYTLIWEYYKWSGDAWTGTASWEPIENVQDDTVSFSVVGANIVRFPQQWKPKDVAVNGVTAYWVRCRLSAVSGIIEGGANQTSAVTYGTGVLTISGTTDIAPGSFTDIYNWLVANKPYISVTKTKDGVFDFTKVGMILNSRVKTTNELIFLGQNSLGNYSASLNNFDFIESGIKKGTRGYDGSTFVVMGTYNSSIFSLGGNSKLYGSVIKVGKSGGDAHLYGGYADVMGEVVDCFFELAPRFTSGTMTNLRMTGSFILVGNAAAVFNGFAYVCSGSELFYKFGDFTGFTITGFDWAFIPATGKIIYLYSYGRRSAETMNFLNPITPLPTFASAIRPLENAGNAVANLLAMKVYDASAGTYTDYTTAASNATADDVPLGGDVGDILYFGSSTYQYAFNLYLVRTGLANDFVYEWEWYTGGGWQALSPYFWDGTSNLSNTGYFLSCTFGATASALLTVDGVNTYWIRARIVVKGTGAPTATQIRYKHLTGVGGWTMYQKYSLDVKVIDSAGNAISGATVKATYSDGVLAFTETTSASGLITQQWMINARYNQDAAAISTYWIKETIMTSAVVEVSKGGNETYRTQIDITKKNDLVIALNPARIQIDQEGTI